MGKRKEESVSQPGSQKRRRQEFLCEPTDEFNEEEHSQLLADSNFSSPSSVGEVGIIESIQLKNFMCHSMLGPFQFGSNLNFVVGNNGSGKSSVLTALIVGLGGKATTTNRGSSLKVFVKDGESSADISITLQNQGRDAFKPEVYGDSIIVNQRINLDGSRSYRLKSKSGTLISSKKEELVAILDHFNIQVDNPVSVLTQEMSKHFLQSKNEGDKYKFFMKATQLEQMKEDYSYIMKTKENTCLQIEQGVERLRELKLHYREKKERYKSIGFVKEMRNHLEDLKHKMAWAVVSEMEREIQPIKESIKVEEERTEKFVQKLEECQVKVNEAKEKYKAIQDKLEKISEEAQALHPQCISSKADVQAGRKAFNEAEALYNRSRTELKRLGRDDEQLRKRIEELKNSANQVSEPEKLERQRKIEQLKEHLKAFHDQEIMISQELDQFQQAIYKCKEEQATLRKEEHDMKQALDSKLKQLRELKDSKTNTLKRFGPHVPAFLEALETSYRQGHFKYKPIGPLGAFIHLKDAELTLAVESCLKGLVQAFCCDNHSDERNLQMLMSKYYPPGFRPQIIVNKFQNKVYDVRHRGVHHPEFPSVLTALEIDDAVVANCLIDMRGIERVLLIKSSCIARKVMQSSEPPKNCREAFTAEGDQVFDRRYYSSDYLRPKYLSKDVEAEISHLEKLIENKKAQLATSQQRLRSIDSEIRQNEGHLSSHRRHQKELQIKIRTTSAEISDLENTEEHQSVDIRTLEDEAEENRNRMESVKQEMVQQSKDMENRRNILQEAEKRFEEMKEKIHQVEEIAGPVKDELNQADCEVENSKRRFQHYEEKQKEHLACIKRRKELLANKEKELEEKIAQAKQIYAERLEVSRTVKSLDAEMNRLRERINSEKDRHGNREEIIQQFYDAKEKFEDANSKVKNLKKFIKLLEEIMTQRFKIYWQFLRLLSLRCKLYFDHLLRIRAYCGKIIFDHKNETLSITVQPGEGDKASLNDVRSLSGGERSFSTVCFILSLWSITESPFRCLDEFDVYMDMVNRRIAMDMMLKVADSQRHRQFILLTPQSMSSLPTSTLIRILRLQDPERGQTTLKFPNRSQEEEDQ
ncbi:structural maintenance of chromosomes protein 6 isoform X1 [Nothoprocta perdicaria]|uniref:structural maintenance of chromosomes protein 6 isoform X1 n=1 Tax=Nothoprocta perdicaria TaxID=30464 RepID=UPI000E1B6B86|nr:structural maintenance of chromosomes protein 6 isoform X1 [Nothoprocta perdicaria]XP_025900655.1 structural maintenance of chromosomes protein 6 isoform X1 [Nothoprocta perdicaria]XP_025900657.1 structural maintenance of chromosomes protein 6 isoform X1 [Nothoprocta perdicaria]